MGVRATATAACQREAFPSSSEGVDFVELCGTQTLALKDCTDAHPEYYGEIAGKDEAEAPPEEAAADSA